MSITDARFEDATLSCRPLRLKAQSADDLAVVSSLLQDAVGKTGNVAWLPKKRRLVAVLNRFRWETDGAGRGTTNQRVQTALTLEGVLKVRCRGICPTETDRVFELLAILFEPTDGCGGTVTLTLAGGAEIAVQVECLDLALADLTRPWQAQHRPKHAV